MSRAQIADERRRGRYAGVAAIGAGVLFPAGLIWSQVTNRDLPEDNTPAQLRFFDRHSEALVASSALRSLSLLLLVIVTVHLYRAIKARKPDANQVILLTGLFGPLALAIGGFAHDLALAIGAGNFTEREFQTIDAAKDVTNSPVGVVTVGLSVAGTLALAFWFVIVSLNAMRIGLLSRFMGVLGIIIGPTFLFPFPPVVMAFWLIAVGALFLGFWPRGMPPAWNEGRAVPWPPRAGSPPEQAEEDGGSRDGEVEPVGPGVHKAEAPPGIGGTGASKARRKRKRRR